MSVVRIDPFREFDRLAELMSGGGGRRGPLSFPLDAYRRGDQFIVELDLPGVAPDAIELTVEQNTLTIKAERRFEPQQDDEVVVLERPQGSFARQLMLGESLDSEHIAASYEDGVLRLAIPVREAAKPRRVQIASRGGGPQTIEGTVERTA